MTRLLLLGPLCVLTPELRAADDLLILALSARVTSAGQVEPVPNPFVESILKGELRKPLKAFRYCRKEFTESAPGPRTLSKTSMASKASESLAASQPSFCQTAHNAVTNYRVLGIAKGRGNQLVAPGSSEVLSKGGFTIAPGQHIPQSVTVRFEGGVVTYYLIFSGAKCVAG